MSGPWLEPRTTWIPLASGIQSKVDPRALPPPALSLCQNAEFDQLGGIQVRAPYASMPSGILGGGSIQEPRVPVAFGDELLLFTSDALFSWSERDQLWVRRSDYLATKVDEVPRFARTSDQFHADKAELDGVAMFAWVEQDAGGSASFVAALDTATGAVLLGPTALPNGATRVRVVAQATQFLVLFFNAPNTIFGFQVDPATLAADVAAGVAAPTDLQGSTTATGSYDAVAGASGTVYVASVETGGSAYDVIRVTDGFAVTSSNVVQSAGPIAIAVNPAETQLVIARYNAVTIRADRRNASTLVAITTDTLLGTPSNATVNQITAAFRQVADAGQFRCFVFWTSGQNASAITGTYTTECNFIDTAATVGSNTVVVRRLSIVSRAFGRGGRVFVWLGFAGTSEASGMSAQLGLRLAAQNAHYLYGDSQTDFDAVPIAKAIPDRAGGFLGSPNLPGVQAVDTDVYSFCAIERRRILLGPAQSGVTSSRAPREVRVTFDSDEARRCAQLGRTLYVAGGLVMQYDGVGLTEVGFHVVPYAFTAVSVSGNVAQGAYNHKGSVSWVNGVQEKERSTTVVAMQTAIAANQRFEFSGSLTPFVYVTHKKGQRTPIANEMWRTIADPNVSSPFNLVTALDPTVTANPNRYIQNDPTDDFWPTFQDNLTDAQLLTRESYYENGGVLINLPPVPASIVLPTQDRLILAGVAGEPYQVFYSKLRGEDEVAAFNGDLRFAVPPQGGPIRALGIMQETLVVFAERAIFQIPGDGFSNLLGQGQNYGPARLLSNDLGAISQETVVLTPRGLIFKSQKGWYLLPGWVAPEDIGTAAGAFDDDEVTAVHVVERQQQVRICSPQRILNWDYSVNEWSEWTVEDARAATVWQGQHVIALTDEVHIQQSVKAGVQLDLETAWLKLSDVLAGHQRIWWFMPTGDVVSPCRLRIRLKRDYDEVTVFDDVTHTPAGLGPLRLRHGPKIQTSEALKIRFTVLHESLDQPPAGEGIRFTGITFEYGIEPGIFHGRSPAQRQ